MVVVVLSLWLRFNTSEDDVRVMTLETIHFKKSILYCKIICHLFLMWLRCTCTHVCTIGKKMKGEIFINATNST